MGPKIVVRFDRVKVYIIASLSCQELRSVLGDSEYMALCKINVHNYLGHLDCLVESVLKTPVKNNLSLLLTNVAILAEEVINPRRLCLGINIWNKDSLVLSPLNAAWYAAFRA